MTEDLLTALSRRVVIADGATGTMLQAHDLTLDDFQGHEGCNEVLNVTRPEVVRSLHDAFFEVGVDAVETNTFGANLANLGEYGIEHRIRELAQAGASIAVESARDWSTPDHQRYVLGSIGPGTKLPTLGHATFAALRDAYTEQVIGMLDGAKQALFGLDGLGRHVAQVVGGHAAASRWYLFSRVLAKPEGDIRKSMSAMKGGRPWVGGVLPVKKSESAQTSKN